MKFTLLCIGLAYKATVFLILLIASRLPDFDQSSPHLSSRWDSLHFQALAQNGYLFEHQWAFFPAIPFVISYFPNHFISGTLIGFISIPSTLALFDLSLALFKSPNFAYLSALLSIFSSSPHIVHISGCAEPLFAFCSYRGMLECSRRRWLYAAVYFTLASALRSNGILLAGFHIWYLISLPILFGRAVSLFPVLSHPSILHRCPFEISLLALSPFLSFSFHSLHITIMLGPCFATVSRRIPPHGVASDYH